MSRNRIDPVKSKKVFRPRGCTVRRMRGESIDVSGPCRIWVTDIRPTDVGVTIHADPDVNIARTELLFPPRAA